nr:RNA-dependent RNA polymerase [Tolivirales sp.]
MQHCPHNIIDSVKNRLFKVTPDPISPVNYHKNAVKYARRIRDSIQLTAERSESFFNVRDEYRPEPVPNIVTINALLHRIVTRLADRVVEKYKPFDRDNFFFNKKGSLRNRYLKARDEILKYGFNIDKDSDIQAFVKLERYFDESKSPRMILGRNPRFNIFYAQFIEPIEKAFFELDEVANGKDHHAVGEQFSKLASRCSHFVENDMSKYESSQRREVLYLEYLFYYLVLSKVCPDAVPLLRLAYAACLHNKVKTSVGVTFKFMLCRVSGDLTTSLGNGVINLITSTFNQVLNSCDPQRCGLDLCNNPGCRVKDIIVKGDDSVLGANRCHKFVNYYKWFGLDAKIIPRANAESVEFCSGGFVEVSPGNWVYVQKLQKLIESLTTCLNEDAVENGYVAQYYYSLGVMYKIVYRGIPVYEDIADFLLKTNRTETTRLNTNLIQSFNLVSAFKADHSVSHVIDKSMAYLGVSLANSMDYAELERIQTWCRNNALVFPEEMRKRKRERIAKAKKDDLTLNWDLLNANVLSSDLSERVKSEAVSLQELETMYHNINSP